MHFNSKFRFAPWDAGKLETREIFEDALIEHYSYIPSFEFRYRTLLPLFALRWSLIVLRRPSTDYEKLDIETNTSSNHLTKKTSLSSGFFRTSYVSHIVASLELAGANMSDIFFSACSKEL